MSVELRTEAVALALLDELAALSPLLARLGLADCPEAHLLAAAAPRPAGPQQWMVDRVQLRALAGALAAVSDALFEIAFDDKDEAAFDQAASRTSAAARLVGELAGDQSSGDPAAAAIAAHKIAARLSALTVDLAGLAASATACASAAAIVERAAVDARPHLPDAGGPLYAEATALGPAPTVGEVRFFAAQLAEAVFDPTARAGLVSARNQLAATADTDATCPESIVQCVARLLQDAKVAATDPGALMRLTCWLGRAVALGGELIAPAGDPRPVSWVELRVIVGQAVAELDEPGSSDEVPF